MFQGEGTSNDIQDPLEGTSDPNASTSTTAEPARIAAFRSMWNCALSLYQVF